MSGEKDTYTSPAGLEKSREGDLDSKSITEHAANSTHNENDQHDEKAPADINPIEALGDPDWRQKEKKLVRTLDMTLLPMLWILYLFNYLDRTNIAQARLNTFEEDLGLVDNQFNIAVSVLTAGYMAAQVPSNLLITRIRPSWYLPGAAILWSIVSCCTAAATNFGSLVTIRLILGFVEAPLFPGAVYVMSCWYTRSELALRYAILYTGLVLAMAVSGLIAAGVFAGLDQVHGLAGWQWLFILEGSVGMGFAILAIFILPDYPHSTSGSTRWSMTEDMRKLAAARMQADRVSEPEMKRTVWFGLQLSLLDYKTYLFMIFNLAITASYGFNNFFPSIVQGFNMGSRTLTLVLTAPPYFFGAFVSLFVCYSSDRNKERGYHIIGGVAVAVVGFIISAASLATAARYTAAFLYIGGLFSINPLVYAWALSTLSSTPEKRAASAAIVNVFGHFGNIMSPYFFPSTSAPRYLIAMLLMMAMAVLTVVMAVTVKFALIRENKKLRRDAETRGVACNPYTL